MPADSSDTPDTPDAPDTLDTPQRSRPPGTFRAFAARFPELADAHQRITDAAEQAGPLDARTCALVRIGLALGAGLDSAVRAHVRRARDAGATEEEIEQAIALGMTTLGFPRTVAGWSWAHMQFERDRRDQEQQSG